jgi:HPt (histidine-containing phosphotransfer) domain-containing protein
MPLKFIFVSYRILWQDKRGYDVYRKAGSISMHLDIEKISQELRIRPQVYVRIAASFAQTLKNKLDELAKAFTDNDTEHMRAILHEIRGTSGNLRIAAVAESEAAMREAVKGGKNREEIQRLFHQLRAASDDFEDFMLKLQSHNEGQPT